MYVPNLKSVLHYRSPPLPNLSSSLVTEGSSSIPGSNSCKLPDHPMNGSYTSVLCTSDNPRPACSNKPGTIVPSNWVLKYTCDGGYSLNNSSTEYSICENGVWGNPLDCNRKLNLHIDKNQMIEKSVFIFGMSTIYFAKRLNKKN